MRREAASASLAEKERRKRQRSEADVEVLRKRCARADAGLPSDDDETELQLYKRLITCNVCNKNTKDTIITKCHHMFCRSCLEENLATRLRKCPTCGLSFGQNDIMEVFM